MYNIFQKQIYIKHYNIIRASHKKLTSYNKSRATKKEKILPLSGNKLLLIIR